MYKILIADDEKDVVSLLKDYFEINGYEVMTAYNGVEAINKIKLQPDLILLDINMPEIDGISVCKNIREFTSCPILFLTAKIEDSDKIMGFAAGGDDYIVKPFSIEELGARVAAHIRREYRNFSKGNIYVFGKLAVNYSDKTIICENIKIAFTKKEFEIIELLSLNKGQVFDKERIYEKIWGYDAEGDSGVVTEHIRRIRVKLKEMGEDYHLQTVWG